MSEEIFNDTELLNDAGEVYNTIVATESYAAQYAATYGGTWRHRPVSEVGE